MRLVSFQYLDHFPRAGVLIGTMVVDLAAAAPLVFEEPGAARWELLDILRGAPAGMGLDGAAEIVAAVYDQLGAADDDELAGVAGHGPLTIGGVEMLMPLDEVRLLAPLPAPRSLRAFSAFEDHVAAAARIRGQPVPYQWYEFPVFSFGNHTAIFGPDADIPLPRTQALDYELEIACVIGRVGRDILAEDATAYIAGYMIMNDWSARDLQRDELAVGLGPAKAQDFATSLGPWLVTPDELEELALGDDRFNLTMRARVNGVERSRGNFRDIYYAFPQLVARAAQDVALYPGDVIGSGAVGGGSLLEQTDGQGPWLEPGDVVELEVTGLGTLRNRIVA